LEKGTNSKAKSAIIWNISGSFLRQVVILAISIILARLLNPVEFGIIGMSMVFIAISEVFIDVGFTSGIIQQKETNDITLSSVFYTNMIISVILSILLFFSAPYIAIFYDEPRVANILMLLTIIPPIAALGKVQAAILTKNLDFKSLTIRNFLATLCGGILGVIAAFSDYGVYSLVIQQITMVTVATVALWYATGWRPKFEYSFDEIKKLLNFSSYVFFDALLRQIFLKIDTLFVGKVFSPTVLGFYSRGESLKTQIQVYTTNSISKVIFPVLSQLQDNDEEFNKTYFKVFNIATGTVVTLIGPIYFLSYHIIIFLFGQKWEPSVIIFQILLLSILTGPQGAVMSQGILAKGQSKLRFKLGLVQRLLKLTPILLGLYFGIILFTWGMVIASLLVVLLFFGVYQYYYKVSFLTQIKNLFIPNLIFIVFIVIDSFYTDLNDIVLACSFLFIHIVYLIILKHESYLFVRGIIYKYLKKKNS